VLVVSAALTITGTVSLASQRREDIFIALPTCWRRMP